MVPESELQQNSELNDLQPRFEVDTNLLEMLSFTQRGEPETWGSTPLNPHREDVSKQQRALTKKHQKLFPTTEGKIPFGLDVPTARFMSDCNVTRVSHRTDKNFLNYGYRGVYDFSHLPAAYAEIVDRAETGHASPAELLFVSTLLEIPAIELASITVGYGQRMEHLEPMREAVNIGVELFNGMNKRSTPHYQVKKASYEHGTDYADVPPSLLMTRTINTGIIQEHNIIVAERSSFVLRIDALDKKMRKQIFNTHADTGHLYAIEDIPGFSDLVTELFEKDAFETLVPISVTAFAVNHNYEYLLHDEKYEEARQLLIARQALASGGQASLI